MKKLFMILLVCFIMILFSNVKAQEDIYDVILFWGQSNMTGYAGINPSTEALTGEDKYDSRITEKGIDNFSAITGIRKEFLTNSTAMNHVNVNHTPSTVYEFKYSVKNIVEIKSGTSTIGENLVYDSGDKTLKFTARQTYFAFQESYGTNLASQFAKTYYDLTGHKVVIVMASNGGEEIAHFLPHNDLLNYSKSTKEESKKQYIYESMVIKYNEALKVLQNQGKKIGNKIYVVMQGESDVLYSQENKNDYEIIFQKVHNNLKKDLSIDLGVMIETGFKNGSPSVVGVKGIHSAQENIINKNSDIILGTSYAYDHFISDSSNYKGTLDYEQALENANLSTCITPVKDNRIHFTAAALSQIGYESAVSAAQYIIKNATSEEENDEFVPSEEENEEFVPSEEIENAEITTEDTQIVEVPDTFGVRNIFIIIISLLLICIGTVFCFQIIKKQKNN